MSGLSDRIAEALEAYGITGDDCIVRLQSGDKDLHITVTNYEDDNEDEDEDDEDMLDDEDSDE